MWVYTLLPKILNMSLTAGIVIVLLLLARILLRKAPKIFSYVLWTVVLFRLVCPVAFSSEFSLLGIFHAPAITNGSITYIPADIIHTEFFVTASPGKYTPAMSSTPGIRLDITYDGPMAQILYEAESGGFITWQNSIIKDLGNSVTRLTDASALYWRPNYDSPKDDVITFTILNEAGGKIAVRAFAITKGDDGFFTAFSKSPGNVDLPSSSSTVEPWELISRAFAEAFFEKNTEVMKSYLIDPDKGFHEHNSGNVLSDVESMKLKFSPNDIKSDSVSAQYEFKFDGDDSYTYLQISMKKVNDVWKIESYGLEK
jgi:hypothetical protein